VDRPQRLVALMLASLLACAGGSDDPGSGGASPSSSGGAGGLGLGGEGGASDECTCESGIHETSILVLSDDAGIWSFDPTRGDFTHVRDVPCAVTRPYSMAVDQKGVAWILDIDSQDVVTVELAGSGDCGDPGYEPGPIQSGFGLFGMAFSTRGPGSLCADLYAHSYSGEGPFDEGPGAGILGRLNAETMRLEILGAVDYDGGELAGTGDGRLFAFAGVDPVKLVEYQRDSGAVVSTLPLDGFDKTYASAFAVFAGQVYFFTEAPPSGCSPCLEANCGGDYATCQADPPCAESLACAIETGEATMDTCGGGLPGALHSCLTDTCGDECLPEIEDRLSRVSRLDLANTQAGVEEYVPEGPIRVVGAGTSICAPVIPR
jgi:hypothetical protein